MRAAFLPLAAALVIGAASRPVTERDAPARTWTRYLVRLENTVWNESVEPISDVEATVLLPQTSARQRVRWVRLSPHDWRLAHDVQGQWHAVSAPLGLGPGETITFAWLASVEIADDDRPTRSLLRPAAERRALASDPVLALDSVGVQQAAAEVRRAAASDDRETLARAALDHVRRRVRYELDGGWRPADAVLEAGVGSCSETTFAFVAICRVLGIPARWAGGTLLRRGPRGRPVDTTFHRVAEVFLPARGWIRVETTPGDGAVPFGAPPLRMLDLALGGEEGSAAGLYYHARNAWSLPRDRARARPRGLKSSRQAFWCAGDSDPETCGRTPPGGLSPIRLSFPELELQLADADGLGARLPHGFAGRPPRDGRRASRQEGARLLAEGHPAGLPSVVARLRAVPDDAELRSLIEDRCAPSLAEEVFALARQEPAAFAAWWSRNARRVTAALDGGLDLADE